MTTHILTNTDVGPRGFWHQDAVVLVDPKQSVDVTDMTDDEVKQAKASGYFEIGISGAAKADDKPDADLIRAAVEGLDGKDDAHWTAAGLPDVSAVSDAMGAKVTRAQIEAAAPDAKRPA